MPKKYGVVPITTFFQVNVHGVCFIIHCVVALLKLFLFQASVGSLCTDFISYSVSKVILKIKAIFPTEHAKMNNGLRSFLNEKMVNL